MAFLGTDFIFVFKKKDGALGLQLRLLDDQIVVTGVSGQLQEEVVRRRQSGSQILGQRVVLVGDLVLAVNGQRQFGPMSEELATAKELYFVIRRHAAACDLDLDAMRPASSEVLPHSTVDDLPPPPWTATAEPASSSAGPAQSAADDWPASPWTVPAEAPASSSAGPAQSAAEGWAASPWTAAAEAPTASSAVPADDSPAPPWEATAEAPATSSAAPAQSTSDDFPASPWAATEVPAKEEATLSTMASETDDPPTQQMLGWCQRAPGEWFHPSMQESFNEGDPNSGWTKYLDEDTSKPWFWHDATGRFFFS